MAFSTISRLLASLMPPAEGLNSKIQTMAYGFRSAIFLHSGGLQLYPGTCGVAGSLKILNRCCRGPVCEYQCIPVIVASCAEVGLGA